MYEAICFSADVHEHLKSFYKNKRAVALSVAVRFDSFNSGQKVTLDKQTQIKQCSLDYAFIPCDKYAEKTIPEILSSPEKEEVSLKCTIDCIKSSEFYNGKRIAVYGVESEGNKIDVKIWEPSVDHDVGSHVCVRGKVKTFYGKRFLQVLFVGYNTKIVSYF